MKQIKINPVKFAISFSKFTDAEKSETLQSFVELIEDIASEEFTDAEQIELFQAIGVSLCLKTK